MTTAAEQPLADELRVLFRHIRELFRQSAAEVHPDLTVTGYVTLLHIVDNGPLRSSTLVQHTGTDKGAVSRQVAHLEEMGLVLRVADPVDRRAQLVSATRTGKRRCQRAKELTRGRVRQRLAHWSPKRLEDFTKMLSAFNFALADDVPNR